MRCACHGCGAYMVHSESLTLVCVCPECGRRCTDCLGTGTLLSKEDFKKECSEQKSKEESSLETLSVEINTKVAELEKERGLVDERKSKLTAQMNQKILSFYQKIRKWAKNTAVVPVRKQACYGCFMKIYDKTYLAILKSEEIVTCPHCGRILYKEPETAGKNAEKSAKKESTQEL